MGADATRVPTPTLTRLYSGPGLLPDPRLPLESSRSVPALSESDENDEDEKTDGGGNGSIPRDIPEPVKGHAHGCSDRPAGRPCGSP